MSGQPYIDGSTLDEAREAIRQGVTLEKLAGQLRVETATLANLLGLPQWKAIPSSDTDAAEFDLFAAERLDGVL